MDVRAVVRELKKVRLLSLSPPRFRRASDGVCVRACVGGAFALPRHAPPRRDWRVSALALGLDIYVRWRRPVSYVLPTLGTAPCLQGDPY